MKLYGFTGKGSGKMGNSVFAISGGEQIVRQYNPVVSNPSTDAQVAQRAKFKLLSQLAAVFAPVLGFVKKGLVSARNQFVSANIDSAEWNVGEFASRRLQSLQLTGGKASLPDVQTTTQGNNFTLSLVSAPSEDLMGVVYVVARINDDEEVEIVNKTLVTDAGQNGLYEGVAENVGFGTFIIYAYGVLNSVGGRSVSYSDYYATIDTPAAILETIIKIAASAGALTKTQSTTSIKEG